MKKAFRVGLLSFALFAVAWHCFEIVWDSSLFHSDDEATILRNVRADEARELLAEDASFQLVDVRPERSYEASRLPNAVHVPYRGGGEGLGDLAVLDRDAPVLVYCDGGFRSRLALQAFEEAGFSEIYHLHRGVLAWWLTGGDGKR